VGTRRKHLPSLGLLAGIARPTRLPFLCYESSGLVCLAAGVVALALEVCLPCAVLWTVEWYDPVDASDCALTIARAWGAGVVTMTVLLLGAAFLWFASQPPARLTPQDTYYTRVVLASPLGVLVPALLWGACFAYSASAQFQLLPGGLLPGERLARIAGSGCWPPAMVGLYFWQFRRSTAVVDGVLAGVMCHACGYQLDAERPVPCPECGSDRIEAGPVPSAGQASVPSSRPSTSEPDACDGTVRRGRLCGGSWPAACAAWTT
jgi:hypothetical protein